MDNNFIPRTFPFLYALIALLYLAVLSGPKDPPSAPALASHYEAPAPALDYYEFPWPPLPDDYPPGGCPTARAAVTAQGVGE